MVWGIQGSGGRVSNVIGVRKRVICHRRVRRGGIEPLFQRRGVGARGWGGAIEILEGQTVLVLVVWQYVVLAGPAAHPRPRSFTTQSRPNRTRGQGDVSKRVLGGGTGFSSYPPPFSFLDFPFAESLNEEYVRFVGWKEEGR